VPSAKPDALFHEDADRFVPTELTRGPWDPRAMHGGAPAALLARAVERFDPGPASHVARMTIELLRPVPLERLHLTTTMVRPGKKVQLVEASLSADDREVVRATALRLRVADLHIPSGLAPEYAVPPPGELVPREMSLEERPWGFGDAIDFAAVDGWPQDRGPGRCWFRLTVPTVAGEENSPLMRVAAAADFGNGISSPLGWDQGWTFINPDLTIYLHRLPEGEWVGLDAVTFPEDGAVGVAESILFDERGRIGRAVQSLLFDRPGDAG
jgi:Thioesterase-like superfamily